MHYFKEHYLKSIILSGILFVLLTPNVCMDMENTMNNDGNEENDEDVDRDDAGEND